MILNTVQGGVTRILGIDPGTHRLGYGLIDSQGGKLNLIEYGCVETAAEVLPGDRLFEIDARVSDLITKYKPDCLAIEELYFAKNVTTGLKVAESRGVVILAARRARLPIAEYKPNLIKSAVAGYGMASKSQIQKMVQLTLKMSSLPKPDDAADGLAVAICHASHAKNSAGRS